MLLKRHGSDQFAQGCIRNNAADAAPQIAVFFQGDKDALPMLRRRVKNLWPGDCLRFEELIDGLAGKGKQLFFILLSQLSSLSPLLLLSLIGLGFSSGKDNSSIAHHRSVSPMGRSPELA
jgi:hypothetical protein